MPNTKLQLIAMSVLAVGMGAAIQACSSSSSGPSCSEICIKEQMCQLDASTATATTSCNAICMQTQTGTGGTGGTTCSNASAMQSALNACLSKTDCTAFNTCIAAIPPCQTGGTGGKSGGTGGTNGAAGNGGGTGGTGGAGGAGAASCSICDKASSCCTALGASGGGTNCSSLSSANCNAQTGSNQQQFIQSCQTILSVGAGLGNAACQ